MKHHPFILGALAVMTAASHAQTNMLATPATLPEVVITGKAEDLLGVAATASKGQANAAEIQSRPYLRRGEILEVIPGVIITQHAGGGKANQYFLRGFNLDHGTDFAIDLDGMPVNMRTHAHGQGYADLNILIPELVERVDYEKGPYFAKNGDLSSAGAAHFKLFDALPQGLASATWGEHNYWRGLLADSFSTGEKIEAHPRARIHLQRRPMGAARAGEPVEWVRAVVLRRRGESFLDHRDGLSRRVAIERPDPAAGDRGWAARPLRLCRSARGRRQPALKPATRLAAQRRRRRAGAGQGGRQIDHREKPARTDDRRRVARERLRLHLRPRSVLELHLLSRRSRAR